MGLTSLDSLVGMLPGGMMDYDRPLWPCECLQLKWQFDKRFIELRGLLLLSFIILWEYYRRPVTKPIIITITLF